MANGFFSKIGSAIKQFGQERLQDAASGNKTKQKPSLIEPTSVGQPGQPGWSGRNGVNGTTSPRGVGKWGVGI